MFHLQWYPNPVTIDWDGVAKQLKENTEKYPHKCPNCGYPAYVGFNQVECSAYGCKHHV